MKTITLSGDDGQSVVTILYRVRDIMGLKPVDESMRRSINRLISKIEKQIDDGPTESDPTRDMFIAAALTGLISDERLSLEILVARVMQVADAVMKARGQ